MSRARCSLPPQPPAALILPVRLIRAPAALTLPVRLIRAPASSLTAAVGYRHAIDRSRSARVDRGPLRGRADSRGGRAGHGGGSVLASRPGAVRDRPGVRGRAGRPRTAPAAGPGRARRGRPGWAEAAG